MVGSLTRQSELFFTPLAQEITRLRDDLLDALDPVLDDGELIALVRQRLATRHPRSHCTGRVGIAPDRLLRCCVLKHLKAWAFRTLEGGAPRQPAVPALHPLRCRSDSDLRHVQPHLRVVGAGADHADPAAHRPAGRQAGVAPGRTLRTDTTVVETKIHHPTDSSQLADGIRVLTRSMQRVGQGCDSNPLEVTSLHEVSVDNSPPSDLTVPNLPPTSPKCRPKAPRRSRVAREGAESSLPVTRIAGKTLVGRRDSVGRTPPSPVRIHASYLFSERYIHSWTLVRCFGTVAWDGRRLAMPVSATRVSGRAVSVQELPLMREIVSRQMRPCTLDGVVIE